MNGFRVSGFGFRVRSGQRGPLLPIVGLFFLAAAAPFAPLTPAPRPPTPEVEITLLHDTHLHGSFFRPDGVGLPQYAGLIAELLDADPHALFVGNGDDLAPSVMSAVFLGRHMVDALNAARLAVNTYGNHELDYGPDNLMDQVRASRFPWVSANVVDRRTGEVFGAEVGARPFVLKEVGGVTLGFTGVAPAETGTISNAGPNIAIVDPIEAVAAVVPRMRAAGAQVVVVLSHLAGPDSDRLAAAVPGIDVILGDHAGGALDPPRVINGAIVSRRGHEYDRLGWLRLRVREGRVVGHTYRALPVSAESPVSPDVLRVVDGYQAELAAQLSVEIGSAGTDLDARRDTVRHGEAAIGNYIADAIRAWAGADVAIQNGGGIRGDKVYPAGPLTRAAIVEILPFQNYVTVVRLSGAQLLEVLENGVSAVETGSGRFLQVSGLHFRYDPTGPPMARVKEVVVGGAALDPDVSYTLAANDFLTAGGDGYSVLSAAEVVLPREAGPLLSAVVIDAIRAAGSIAPTVEGRIVITDYAGRGRAGRCPDPGERRCPSPG